MRILASLFIALATVNIGLALPEAIEIGTQNIDQLPGGREADGIIGDFVLRNDRIEAVISGNMPNRKANSMTWRTEIRTPGLPAHVRRLGDLRLECRVGMEAGLVSDDSPFLGSLIKLVVGPDAYCDAPDQQYLFFSERPLFSVNLHAGGRSEMLSLDRLYAGISRHPITPS